MIKTWKPGTITAPWELLIQASHINDVDSIIKGLCYYLTDCNSDYKIGIEKIKLMSGEEILNSLESQYKNAYTAVKNGLDKR